MRTSLNGMLCDVAAVMSSFLYQINLQRSERLQLVAMHVVDGGEA